jgi:hypothetical protein
MECYINIKINKSNLHINKDRSQNEFKSKL